MCSLLLARNSNRQRVYRRNSWSLVVDQLSTQYDSIQMEKHITTSANHIKEHHRSQEHTLQRTNHRKYCFSCSSDSTTVASNDNENIIIDILYDYDPSQVEVIDTHEIIFIMIKPFYEQDTVMSILLCPLRFLIIPAYSYTSMKILESDIEK